ncbi:retrovirus-related pol polyprotein from transposon TNT 1-94 [Tanacetum coccineum]
MATEVPHTLEYRGGHLNAAPLLEVENFTNWKKRNPEVQWSADERKAANLDQRLKSLIMSVLTDDQMNSVINCLTAKSTWDDLILYHEGPSDVKESRVMDMNLCYNTFKFKEGENLTQTFTRYKALMNELVNDGIKLSKLEINTNFINGLPKKWLSFCQSLRNTNHVKESKLASLFGKLKYEENLIDNIYENENKKALTTVTPLSTVFISTFVVQDFQDSPDDEDDTRSSQEYLNDLEEDNQARALLAKSKRYFKKGSQRFSSAKATVDTQCHKCGRNGHFARDCFSKTSVPPFPYQIKTIPSRDLPAPLTIKLSYFEAKYNKVKAKLALLSPGALASSSTLVKNKGLIAETYEWDEEDVSPDDNKVMEVKGLMALAEERKSLCYKECARKGIGSSTSIRTEQIPSQKKRILGVDQLTEDPSSSGHKDLVFIKSSVYNTKASIPCVERPWLSKSEGFILPNHDTGRILPAESQRNLTDPLVAVIDSLETKYDSADESSVCSTSFPPLEKPGDVEPVSGLMTLKSISTFKSKALKAPAENSKNVKSTNNLHLATVIKDRNDLKLQVNKNQSSQSRDKQVSQNTLQNKKKNTLKKSCELCGLKNHLSEKCYKVLFCMICGKIDHRTCDHAKYTCTIKMSQHLTSLGKSSSRSKNPRPSKCLFPPYTHYSSIDHLSDDCLYYPICGIYGSYDQEANGHNRIISLEREINPRNPQHPFKRSEVCGSSIHTTTDHYDIEWFKRGEALQSKRDEDQKGNMPPNSNRSKNPTKRWVSQQN